MGKDVSIIIINYNTINLLIDCINSIIEKTKDIDYEIIVVDNASSDNHKEVLTKLFGESVTIIDSHINLGFGKANNLGINAAKGRNILFLNPDTLLINNAVNILSNYLDNNDSVAGCGGNLYDIERNPIHSYNVVFPSIFDEIDQSSRRFISKLIWGKSTIFNYGNTPKEVAYITGADLMIKKSILNSIGAFNPEYFMYFEETDLQKRIKNQGYKIYNLPSAKIIHLEGKSFKASRNRELMSLSSRKIYFRLHHSPLYCYLSDILYLSMVRIGLFVSKLSKDTILKNKLSQRLELFKDIYK